MCRQLHLSRFILPFGRSGSEVPSTIRSVDCQVRVSPSTCVMIVVAVTCLPSLRVDVVLMIHCCPSLLQIPSPKPPLSSKLQDRIWWATGSQPIHWLALPTGRSFRVVVRDATMKFWWAAQVKD